MSPIRAGGLFFPISTGSESLKDVYGLLINVITTIHYRNGSESFREYSYVVYLLGEGEKRVRIGRSREYAVARAMAEDVGRFLGLSVLDATGDTVVVLPAVTLGLSVKDKARIEGIGEMPPTPPGLRSKVHLDGERVIVEMPRQSNTGCLMVWLLMLVSLLGLLSYIFIDSKGNWAPVAFYAAIGGLVLAILYGAVAPSRTVLEITPDGLGVREEGLIFTSRRHLPAESIRELRLDLFHITVLTVKETVSFGLCLDFEERVWVHALLHHVLAA